MTAAPAPPEGSPPAAHLKQIGVQPSLLEYIADLWAHRDFLITVPLGELRAQNQNSVLGNFWHLLNPLLLAGVYYLVFGVILSARGGIDYYPAFLIVGIMTFTFYSKMVQAGARTVVANLRLIQSIRFPRASLPLASTLSETIAHGPALLTMMLLVVLTSQVAGEGAAGLPLPPIWPTWQWLLLVPATLLLALFGLGSALITARATFHFRDVQQLLPYLLRIWMYLSGLFYSVDYVVERLGEDTIWVTVFKANPMWQFFRIFRDIFVNGVFDPVIWISATAWSLATVVLGFLWFRTHEVEYSRG